MFGFEHLWSEGIKLKHRRSEVCGFGKETGRKDTDRTKEKTCERCCSGGVGPMTVQSTKATLFHLTHCVSYSLCPAPHTASLCELMFHTSLSPAQTTLEKSIQLSNSHHLAWKGGLITRLFTDRGIGWQHLGRLVLTLYCSREDNLNKSVDKTNIFQSKCRLCWSPLTTVYLCQPVKGNIWGGTKRFLIAVKSRSNRS